MAKLIAHNPPTAKLKSSGFIGAPTGDIELTENHKTTNVSAFATATVNVPDPTGTIEITENGTFDVFNYAEADVNIKTYEEELAEAEAQIEEDNGYFSDISEAIVDKDGGEPPERKDVATRIEALPTNLIPKTITENGVYNASSDNADGYDVVTVAIPTTQGVLYGNANN